MSRNAHSTPLISLDAVVLDTETTGLDASTARIVQIGAVRVEDGAVEAGRKLDRLVNPGIPIPPATTAIHGLGDDDVRGAPSFAEVAGELASFIDGALVVGHTISYDLTVLEQECRRAGVTWRRPGVLDVRTLAELALPALAQYDLERIAAALDVRIEGRHTAIGDAVATARIFVGLLPHLRQRGIRTLAEVEQAIRQLMDRQLAAGRASVKAPPSAADPARALARIDSFPYRHTVADLMSAPPIWSPPEATVGAALKVLLDRRVSSVLVNDAAGTPGIATERDLLRAINRHGGAALAMPVAEFASQPLQSIPADTFVYRAIGRLDRLDFRHLAVSDAAGSIIGMVTTRNLLRHRAQTAIALGDEIDAAGTVAALGAAWAKVPLVARSLVDEEVDARRVASVISTEVCALTRRAAELAEARMLADGRGPPPCRYAVLVLGSAGRGESLLAADQDNAIVYERGDPDGPEDRWLAELATVMCAMLDAVGIPFCKGGVMAKNAAWRQSVPRWKATAEGWVRRQRPEDLLNVDIFFDAAVVHGEEALGDEVIAHAFALAGRARDFQVQIAELARRWQPPFTLFGNFRTDTEGRVDLKIGGLLPIFTAARALAIKHDLRARGTPGRLRAFAARTGAADEDIERLIEAHGIVLRALLGQQLVDIELGVAPSARVDLKRLAAPERAALKAAVQDVRIATALVGEGRV